MSGEKKILIYGYGNPGRMDDGAGIRFTEEMESWIRREGIKNIRCETNYQLNIEDAEVISHYDLVFFADASLESMDDYYLSRILPSDSRIEFSMHAVSPAFVLNLCNQMFERAPEVHLIHIKGYEWDFKEGISENANRNIKKALAAVQSLLKKEWIRDALDVKVASP